MFNITPQSKDAGNSGTSGGLAGALSSGMGAIGSGFRSLFGRSAGAQIKRPVVAGPNPEDYRPTATRPVVGLPTRADFGPAPDKTDILNARKDVAGFRKGFNDPTHTTAFQNLMGYTEETTGAQEAEVARAAREASSRAGYAGGFNQAAKQAARDRMTATATAGFEGADAIRKQELEGYGLASTALTGRVGSYNDTMSRINTAFGNALASAHETQGHIDLGFADLVQKGQLSYADAVATAKQLQAQLDQAFNGSLIDNAKYMQMQRSLEVEWARAQQALAEQAREFDVTQRESNRRFDLGEGDTLADIAKQRTSLGIDPTTGEHYGPAHPWRG